MRRIDWKEYVLVVVLVFIACIATVTLAQAPKTGTKPAPAASATHDDVGQPLGVITAGRSRSFTAQTATGQTTGYTLGGILINHTANLVVTGAPTGCTYRLQGSRDGTNWFNISGTDITCTASAVASYANFPAQYVRGNLLTLTGGTTPSVTLQYIGK